MMAQTNGYYSIVGRELNSSWEALLLMHIQWNLDITNLFITKYSGSWTILLTPVIAKYMEKNLDIMKPRYSEQILPVPWPFVVSRFYCSGQIKSLDTSPLWQPHRQQKQTKHCKNGKLEFHFLLRLGCFSVLTLEWRRCALSLLDDVIARLLLLSF